MLLKEDKIFADHQFVIEISSAEEGQSSTFGFNSGRSFRGAAKEMITWDKAKHYSRSMAFFLLVNHKLLENSIKSTAGLYIQTAP